MEKYKTDDRISRIWSSRVHMLNFIALHVMSVLENLHSQNQSLSYNSVMLFCICNIQEAEICDSTASTVQADYNVA